MKRYIIPKAYEYVRNLFNQYEDGAKLSYHNWQHTENVVMAAKEIAANSGLSESDIDGIEVAALFHDVGYLFSKEDHEESGAKIAMDFLDTIKCNRKQIDMVRRLIMATKMNQEPKSIEEEIIKDADMSHFGKEDFLINYQDLLMEMRDCHGVKLTDEEWRQMTLTFMDKQKYFTDYAKTKFEHIKEQNIKKLKEIEIMETPTDNNNKEEELLVKEPEKKKKKKADKSNIPEKGIETMFRVALRNHVNLSRIADNKANTLISVNAIIISIVLGTLFPKLDSNPFLVYPGYTLLAFCIITIIISIFSTIPKTTHGQLSRQAIMEKKGNLLFFGNFHSMSLEDYEWGISEVMTDKKYLYNNLTRDLYFLGKVLNRKYRLLRYSYFSFVIGLLVSIALFIMSIQLIS